MGYRADVIEFIPIDHTAKNLMIRAVRTGATATHALIEEYQSLKAYWGVTPYLETLLGSDFSSILAASSR